MKLKIFTLIIIGIGLFSLLKYALSGANKTDSETLVVGMMSGWAPFMSINPQGEFEGFDVDVAQELSRRLNKKCQILDMGSLASLFVALESNKIDVIFSGLDINQKRMQQMNMIPYSGNGVKEYSLLFWDEIPAGLSSIDDLKNYPNPVVVVEPGDSPEKYLEQFPFIIKKQIASLADQILDIKYAKSLALFREPQVARMIMRKNPQFKSLSVPLPPEFQIYGMGIAAKKSNQELADRIQAAIAAMKNDGVMRNLESKWQLGEANNEI